MLICYSENIVKLIIYSILYGETSMEMQNLLNDLKDVLKGDERLIKDGKLFKNKIIELALQVDKELVKLLLSNPSIKKNFFQ